jgi:3-dehydroquinate synthetase
VIALGGGVTGDLTGFAAATYLRGIPWIAAPTSLLAMVDASLVGKTGADLPQGKNLVGAFHPPRLVLADPQLLSTLPEAELRSGMAEVVKGGVIGDPALFDRCAGGWAEIQADWSAVIRRTMAVKIQVILADPYERGPRAVLNFGHTFGHAIEMLSGYRLRHGEAVSWDGPGYPSFGAPRLAEAGWLGRSRLSFTVWDCRSGSRKISLSPRSTPPCVTIRSAAGGDRILSYLCGLAK